MHTKQKLKILLFFLLVVGCFSVTTIESKALSSSGKCGDNLTYTYSTGVVTISGTGPMSDANYGPFKDNTGITSVIIEEGVTTICSKAFYNCTNLKSIVLPDSLEAIGGQAFLHTAYYNNEGNWQNNVLYIGNHLIEAKADLTGHYSVKNGTVSIGYGAFSNCGSLTGVSLPDSLKYIHDYAFSGCTELSSLRMSQNIKKIGSWAFGYMKSCSKLTNISLPNKVIDMHYTTFKKTGYAYNSSNWVDGALYIDNHLLDVDDYNKFCAVRKGTVDIARGAFEDSGEMRIISIPDSVMHIGSYLLYNCSNLKKIYFAGTETQWKARVDSPNKDLQAMTIVFGKEHEHLSRVVKENEIATTCSRVGEYTNVSYCDECEIEVERERIIVPALGHSFEEWKQTKNATCTDKGEKVRTCSLCSENQILELKELGHNYSEWKQTKKATCDEEGEKVRSCSRCTEKELVKIDALGHKFSKSTITKQPTCTETGLEAGTCTRCKKETTNVLPAKGHKVNEYVIKVEPSCTEPGIQTGTCVVCGATHEKEIVAKGHLYGDATIVRDATETETGMQTKQCALCGYLLEEEIPIVGTESFKDESLENETDGTANEETSTNKNETPNMTISLIIGIVCVAAIGWGIAIYYIVKRKKMTKI